MDRRTFLRGAPVLGLAVAVPVVAELAKSPRELAVWHMRELERLAKADGAEEVMVVVTGRFFVPDFHCKTLMTDRSGKLNDFGSPEFLPGTAA